MLFVERITQPARTGDVNVTMTLRSLEGGNDTYIQLGTQARFTCDVFFPRPLSSAEKYNGITLRIVKAQSAEYEDGCLITDTIIPDNKKFFQGANKTCPQFESWKTQYSAVIDFTVTAQFIGKGNQYRCNFRGPTTIHQSNFRSILGINLPTLTVLPSPLALYEGVVVELKCTSRGGYPHGEASLWLSANSTLAGARKLAQTAERPAMTAASHTVQSFLEIKREHHGFVVICTNSRHESALGMSEPILVFYLRERVNINETRIFSVDKDIKVNCSKSVESSSSDLQYMWSGKVVPYSQLSSPLIDIPYEVTEEPVEKVGICNVAMRGDPFGRVISIHYTFQFAPAPTVASAYFRSVALALTATLFLTIIIIGFSVAREVTSRKINNRKARKKRHGTKHTKHRKNSKEDQHDHPENATAVQILERNADRESTTVGGTKIDLL